MNKMYLPVALFWALSTAAYSQTIARFSVALPKPGSGLELPTSIDLDRLTFLPDSAISLVEVQGAKRVTVPFQIQDNGQQRTMYWQVLGDSQKTRSYEIVKKAPEHFDALSLTNKDGQLTFQAGNQPLLNYYSKKLMPPAGVDTAYGRSGFIHPLYAPHGQMLTRIQAPDHYHHYGIWNPWTHVLFEGKQVDFWNIGSKQGTVRFAKLLASTVGPVFSEYEVMHEHVVFNRTAKTEKVALNEVQTVRVYNPEKGKDYYIVDITSNLSCATQSPFHIEAYRYAGFGWRTTEFWDDNNCEVLTSTGSTRDNTDNTKARWAIVQGALPNNDAGGVAWLSYPANFDHPEPMRIWVKGTNKRGDMYFNFAPTKDKDWVLEPGKTYVLKYRLIVFNGKIDAAKAESAWQYFATPPLVTAQKIDNLPAPRRNIKNIPKK
jgi:hypothetical protein